MLSEVVEMAGRYKAKIETLIRRNIAPDAAAEAKNGKPRYYRDGH
jgi:hypothetical protein